MRSLNGCSGGRIAGGEERDFVSSPDEFFSQISNDAFGATVKLGRHAFIQRSHLRNAEAAAIVVQHFPKSYIWFSTILVPS
jgi:hypothetical protein